MSILSNSYRKSSERGFALQKYLLLHSQHDALRKHIESISQPPPIASMTSSPPPLTLSNAPSSSEIEEEELKLINVNQQIKNTLTELLNCESVRSDHRWRCWIQTRLMDAERELKGSRSLSLNRRRSIDVGNAHAQI